MRLTASHGRYYQVSASHRACIEKVWCREAHRATIHNHFAQRMDIGVPRRLQILLQALEQPGRVEGCVGQFDSGWTLAAANAHTSGMTKRAFVRLIR